MQAPVPAVAIICRRAVRAHLHFLSFSFVFPCIYTTFYSIHSWEHSPRPVCGLLKFCSRIVCGLKVPLCTCRIALETTTGRRESGTASSVLSTLYWESLRWGTCSSAMRIRTELSGKTCVAHVRETTHQTCTRVALGRSSEKSRPSVVAPRCVPCPSISSLFITYSSFSISFFSLILLIRMIHRCGMLYRTECSISTCGELERVCAPHPRMPVSPCNFVGVVASVHVSVPGPSASGLRPHD